MDTHTCSRASHLDVETRERESARERERERERVRESKRQREIDFNGNNKEGVPLSKGKEEEMTMSSNGTLNWKQWERQKLCEHCDRRQCVETLLGYCTYMYMSCPYL